jgi:glucose/arabinose dehydrogenase
MRPPPEGTAAPAWAKEAIYSFGHRNPQGMVKNPETGKIWVNEHGPQGGDEINIINNGLNYGWPVICYCIDYNDANVTDNTAAEGMEQPIHYWFPSIAPSGMAFVSSNNYPQLTGSLLVGSLKFQYLERLILDADNKVTSRESLLSGIGRVREVKQGPDGFIYIAVEGIGIVRLIEE